MSKAQQVVEMEPLVVNREVVADALVCSVCGIDCQTTCSSHPEVRLCAECDCQRCVGAL